MNTVAAARRSMLAFVLVLLVATAADAAGGRHANPELEAMLPAKLGGVVLVVESQVDDFIPNDASLSRSRTQGVRPYNRKARSNRPSSTSKSSSSRRFFSFSDRSPFSSSLTFSRLSSSAVRSFVTRSSSFSNSLEPGSRSGRPSSFSQAAHRFRS